LEIYLFGVLVHADDVTLRYPLDNFSQA